MFRRFRTLALESHRRGDCRSAASSRRRPLRLEALEARVVLSAGAVVESMWYFPPGEQPAESPQEFNASGAQWPQPNGDGSPVTITYSYSNLLDGDLPGGLSISQLKSATEEALGLWAAVAPLDFVEMEDSGPAAGDSGYTASGRPQIRIGHHFIDGASGSNVLAHAFFPGGSGLSGDIHFDNGNNWSNHPNSGVDVIEVMTHELGHSLGLGHEDGAPAIMGSGYGGRYNGAGTGFLFQDDIDGIRSIYGTGVGSVTPLPDAPVAVDDAYSVDEDSVLVVTAAAQKLVGAGADWSYLDDGSDQGTAWIDPAFDDSAWSIDTAQLGYGDGDEATEISFGADPDNKHVTTYFRHTFTLADPGAVDQLLVRLLRDDGAAVYLNGVELVRADLASTATFDTLAGATISGGAENQFEEFEIDVSSLPPGALAAGENVLAVEIHQAAADSSDVSFDLELLSVGDGEPGLLVNDFHPSNQPFTARLDDPPDGGSVDVQPDGSFTYTPEADFFGVDTFTYVATDGQRDSQPATVTITVPPAPDVPVALNDAYSTAEDTPLVTGTPTELVVADGSEWRYLDDGSNQQTAWRESGFDDSSWSTGAAQLGYGDNDEATTVRFSNGADNKFATSYFRARFNVDDAAALTDLTLDLLRDDAAAVYINGVEVFRDATLPPDAAFDRYADGNISPEGEFELFAIDHTALLTGENVIAVEVHQGTPGSSDVSFDLALDATATDVPIELLAIGSDWSYLDDGSDQGVAWREAAFDDSAWAVGPAELGYGEGDEATVIAFSNDEDSKFTTTYFRRAFTLTDAARVDELFVELLRDDGAAVYLNGVELVRSNLGAGAAFDDFATDTVSGADEDEFLPFSIPLDALPGGVLVEGENTLAVEVHQANPTSSDLSFDLRLTVSRDAQPDVLANDLDADGEPLTVIVESQPAHGQLTIDAQGHLTYTPEADFFGQDSFTYRASDSADISLSLVQSGADWGYLDDGSDQGAAWREPAFDDGAWAVDQAELGYGDGDEATVIGLGPDEDNKFATTYFRSSFDATGLGAFATIRGRLIRDDAAAVYLNGVEVFRDDHLPDDAAFDTFADSTISDETTPVEFTFDPALLIDGQNVLAVEVHQASGTSSDVSFDLELAAVTPLSGIATVTIDVAPVNDPPTADEDEYNVDSGQTLTIDVAAGVLANDTDPEDDPLTAALVDAPGSGSLSLAADGSFVYTPEVGFSGQDSFTYRAADAPPTTLLARGADWRYLDDGSNQGLAWRTAAFDDASWEVGPAQLGYGEGDEATTVSFANDASSKFITTYFRRRFDVIGAGDVTALDVELLRDDGAAVYLNGVELARDNLAAGAGYRDPANGAIGGADEDTFFPFTIDVTTLPPGTLVEGENVLAVEVHQANGASSDISFDLRLSGETPGGDVPWIADGSTWSYLDNGTDQGAAWRAPAFDDGAWPTGAAQLGYGDGDESTLVRFANDADSKHATTYFRNTFPVDDAGALTSLNLWLLREDAAAVFVNGAEVYRDATLTADAPFDEYAAPGAANDPLLLALDPAVLVDGANTIAVEIHLDDPAGAELSFDLELTAAVESNLATVTIDVINTLPGDFNGDDRVLADDIDALYSAINSGAPDPRFDLTGEGDVDQQDVDLLVTTVVETTAGVGTLFGDANFDGRVDRIDAAIVLANYGFTNGPSWARGDFDGTGRITLTDARQVQENLGAAPSAPPAPSALVVRRATTAATRDDAVDSPSRGRRVGRDEDASREDRARRVDRVFDQFTDASRSQMSLALRSRRALHARRRSES